MLPQAGKEALTLSWKRTRCRSCLPSVRRKAIACIAGLLAQEGTLLVICRGRSPEEHPGTMPWPLTKEDVEGFKSLGLRQVQFEDYFDQEEPPRRRFRVEYQRAFIR